MTIDTEDNLHSPFKIHIDKHILNLLYQAILKKSGNEITYYLKVLIFPWGLHESFETIPLLLWI